MVFASGFPADVANRRDGDVPFDDGYLCDFLTALHMSLYWLCYRHNNQISVVIEPGASPIHARMRAALSGLDEGTFDDVQDLSHN
jgi:hypothetical protein